MCVCVCMSQLIGTSYKNKNQKIEREVHQEINHNKDSTFNIPDRNFKYGEILTPDIRKEFGKVIKNEDGKVICHRFHIKDICDSNCRFKASHKPISKDKTKNLLEFAEFVFDKKLNSKKSTDNKKADNFQG